jgi:hypothetical protein
MSPPATFVGVTVKGLPEQMGSGVLSAITGAGFTVIVKISGGPVQETPPIVNVGVTVTVAITGALVLLTVVNAAKLLPAPFNPAPIFVFICQA